MNCAIGLAELGPHTLRTLLIGLHDANVTVRKTIEKVIAEQISIEAVINYFGDEAKASQLTSLKIAVREILDKELPMTLLTIDYFKDLLFALDKIQHVK